MKNKPIVAIMYDFDKTLSSDDMQNFGFVPSLNMTPAEFWALTKEIGEKEGLEGTMAYMYMMVKCCKDKGIKLTKSLLNEVGKNIKYYEGVTTWFKRINQFAEEQGLEVEHYIISSGNKEIVDGCSIAPNFKQIYGCEFFFNEDGEAIWPKISINYTSKTQFLFRISKGALDASDDKTVNTKIETKRIPFHNFIYLGDGLTDVPCMQLVKEKGGKSIAIYPKGNKEKVIQLFEEGRVNYLCSADYKAGSNLEKIIKLILTQMALTSTLLSKENEMYNK